MTNQEIIQIVDELRALPKEIEWVEFKTGTATTNEKLGQYISAISNASCLAHESFGYLIFGIQDDTHEVVGTKFKFKDRKEENQELELWIRRLLHPSVNFQHFTCQYNEFYLEVFKIPAAVSEPTHFKKIPYIRFNSSLTDLRNFPHHIREIYNSHIDWSAQVIDKATIKDLEPEAIVQAREKYKEKNTGKSWFREIDHWDDSTFLDRAKITIGGKITNTAIVLLGKEQSAHFISPAVAQITWKLDTEEKAYEHFEMPLFLSTNDVLKRIRNVKYKFFPDNQLIATEVQKYDTEVILEALNNCIAHQDYGQNSRIVLVEKVNKLIFRNAGDFYEGKAEDYCEGNRTPQKYRNKWLANAMVNLNMIDSLGFGISKMYNSQRKRYFPLPDYSSSSSNEVVLEIYGNAIDEKYSKLLIEKKESLSLTEVVLLDKIQKGHSITEDAARLLKKNRLIEGRKPHYHISSSIASATGQEAKYLQMRGIEDDYCKKMIVDYLAKFKGGKRSNFEELIKDKLPALMTEAQKKDKVKNLLQAMKREGKIYLENGVWYLHKSKS